MSKGKPAIKKSEAAGSRRTSAKRKTPCVEGEVARSAAKPPPGTWALCETCGMACVHKNATTGWRHSLLGVGTDHDPAPTGWTYAESPAAKPAAVGAIDGLIAEIAEAVK